MKYRRLGTSQLEVSEISMGCMSLGTDHSTNIQLLHHACDQGINFFDTADLYDKGENERSVGRAFKDRRDKVIIATKVGNQWRSDGTGWDWNPSKEYILKAVEASLRRLETDYIDLYQLHGGTIDDPINETIEAFELLKTAGKIRYYGISSIRPNVIRTYIAKSHISSVMMQYSLLDRRPEEAMLDLLYENQIGVPVRGAVAKGLLVDKTPRSYLDYSVEDLLPVRESLEQMAIEARTPAQTAMQYVLQNPAVTTVVAGMSTPQQIEENVQASHSSALSEQELEKIKQVSKASVYEQHR